MLAERDRRQAARRRSLLRAKFVSDHPPMTIDCAIRDLTRYGARVVFPASVVAPARGWLINVAAGAAHETVAIWRAGGLRGVKFVRTVDVTRPQPGPLNQLHRLWLEAAPRTSLRPREGAPI